MTAKKQTGTATRHRKKPTRATAARTVKRAIKPLVSGRTATPRPIAGRDDSLTLRAF